MNMMEETRGTYRVEFVGMSIREIKDVLEDKWGSMVWSRGRAYPSDNITLRVLVAPSKAAKDVMDERNRQIHAEGWTAAHDDQHADQSLALAAAWYATPAFTRDALDVNDMGLWPATWLEEYFKPGDRRRELVKAGALILAEIERIDRAEAKGGAA